MSLLYAALPRFTLLRQQQETNRPYRITFPDARRHSSTNYPTHPSGEGLTRPFSIERVFVVRSNLTNIHRSAPLSCNTYPEATSPKRRRAPPGLSLIPYIPRLIRIIEELAAILRASRCRRTDAFGHAFSQVLEGKLLSKHGLKMGSDYNSDTFLLKHYLKGQCHEIFCFRFFS
jgi:hypothetical protein